MHGEAITAANLDLGKSPIKQLRTNEPLAHAPI